MVTSSNNHGNPQQYRSKQQHHGNAGQNVNRNWVQSKPNQSSYRGNSNSHPQWSGAHQDSRSPGGEDIRAAADIPVAEDRTAADATNRG